MLAVPFWTLGESSAVDGNEVRLVSNDAKAKGTLWAHEVSDSLNHEYCRPKHACLQQCHADQWEVQFEVTVTGDNDTPGKGLAFWYTSNIMQPGILFGSEERYEGFGLLFDSYDDDGKVSQAAGIPVLTLDVAAERQPHHYGLDQ